jgi:hypothetical protein
MVIDVWTPSPLCKTYFCPVLKSPSPSPLVGSFAIGIPIAPLASLASTTREVQLLVPELSNSIPLQDFNVRNGLLMQEHANPTTADLLLVPNEGMLPLESSTYFGLGSF